MANPDLELEALRQWDGLAARMSAPLRPGRPRRALGRRALGFGVTLLLLAVLPFLVLVRVSVSLYLHERTSTWLALAAGAACTLALVAAYAAWVWHRLTGRMRLRLMARRAALPLVVAYCGYTLVYLSAANAKSDHVRAFYTSLHPLLRVALSTLILADDDIVITDLARRPEDYVAMGLPVYDGSLHYVQPDGYVHAADLRTIGRSEVQNRVVQVCFVVMGFATLRHVGTADHLHVELPAR